MEILDLYEDLLSLDDFKSAHPYRLAVSKVLEEKKLVMEELIRDIPYYIYSYQYGEDKERNYGHNTVSCALKKVQEYFVDGLQIGCKMYTEMLDYESYIEIRKMVSYFNEMNRIVGKENSCVISEIKHGCVDFSAVINGISAMITLVTVIKAVTHSVSVICDYKQILKRNFIRIEELGRFEKKILRMLVKQIAAWMDRKKQEYIEIGIGKFKMRITEDVISEIREKIGD